MTDVTDKDLAAQYEFGVPVRDQLDHANRAVIEIQRVKRGLEERLEGVDDEGWEESRWVGRGWFRNWMGNAT